MLSQLIGVESGKLVVVPAVEALRDPLREYKLFVQYKQGWSWVQVETIERKGKRIAARVIVTPDEPPETVDAIPICSVRPTICISDASFAHQRGGFGIQEQTGDFRRASQAAKKLRGLAGSYRTSDGQVGCCIKMPFTDGRLLAKIEGDRIEIDCTPIDFLSSTEQELQAELLGSG